MPDASAQYGDRRLDMPNSCLKWLTRATALVALAVFHAAQAQVEGTVTSKALGVARSRLVNGRPDTIPALKEVSGLGDKARLAGEKKRRLERLDNLFAALELTTSPASFTNDSLQLWLGKKKGQSGIAYNSYLGVVTDTSEDAYGKTGSSLDLNTLRDLLRRSADAGHTAQALVGVAFSKKDQPWQVFLLGVEVGPGTPTNPLLSEIKKRFNLVPPMTLSVYIYDAARLYVAAYGPEGAS